MLIEMKQFIQRWKLYLNNDVLFELQCRSTINKDFQTVSENNWFNSLLFLAMCYYFLLGTYQSNIYQFVTLAFFCSLGSNITTKNSVFAWIWFFFVTFNLQNTHAVVLEQCNFTMSFERAGCLCEFSNGTVACVDQFRGQDFQFDDTPGNAGVGYILIGCRSPSTGYQVIGEFATVCPKVRGLCNPRHNIACCKVADCSLCDWYSGNCSSYVSTKSITTNPPTATPLSTTFTTTNKVASLEKCDFTSFGQRAGCLCQFPNGTSYCLDSFRQHDFIYRDDIYVVNRNTDSLEWGCSSDPARQTYQTFGSNGIDDVCPKVLGYCNLGRNVPCCKVDNCFSCFPYSNGCSINSTIAKSSPMVLYNQTFNFVDGTTDLRDNSTIGIFGETKTSVRNNQLRLVENIANQAGAFFLPAATSRCAVYGWRASFTVRVYWLEKGGIGHDPGLGMTFAWAPILPRSTIGWYDYSLGFQQGKPGLSFNIRLFEDRTPNWMAGFDINTSGNSTPSYKMHVVPVASVDGRTTIGNVMISWSPYLGASFMTTNFANNANYINVPVAIDNATVRQNFVFGFAALTTGSIWQELSIDDIVIISDPQPDCETAFGSLSDCCKTLTTVTTKTTTEFHSTTTTNAPCSTRLSCAECREHSSLITIMPCRWCISNMTTNGKCIDGIDCGDNEWYLLSSNDGCLTANATIANGDGDSGVLIAVAIGSGFVLIALCVSTVVFITRRKPDNHLVHENDSARNFSSLNSMQVNNLETNGASNREFSSFNAGNDAAHYDNSVLDTTLPRATQTPKDETKSNYRSVIPVEQSPMTIYQNTTWLDDAGLKRIAPNVHNNYHNISEASTPKMDN